MEKLDPVKQTRIVSLILFSSTLIVVLTSLTTAIFPALVLRTLGGMEDNLGVDPFETGAWAYPILISNFIVFALLILYFKNYLPSIIRKSIIFIFNFEISLQVSCITIVVLIGIYILFFFINFFI